MSIVEKDAGEPGELSAEVRRGNPTDEELAALVAVVSEAYEREVSAAVVDETATSTAWSRSQRAPRRMPRRDVAWGRFAG